MIEIQTEKTLVVFTMTVKWQHNLGRKKVRSFQQWQVPFGDNKIGDTTQTRSLVCCKETKNAEIITHEKRRVIAI